MVLDFLLGGRGYMKGAVYKAGGHIDYVQTLKYSITAVIETTTSKMLEYNSISISALCNSCRYETLTK
jgi:hypothetical protein